MNTKRRIGIGLGLIAAALALTACGSDDNGNGDTTATTTGGTSTLPVGSEPVTIDPADFTTEIDNPYWPMTVGSVWKYTETDAKGNAQDVVVTVTDQTKEIANGVTARVVHDVVSEDGEPVEVTDDWYAQDSDGNIWYLGEDTAEYENGKVKSHEGSFEAGVDGALPGIAIPANPEPGLTYRQEYLKGEAEDYASVLSVDAHAESPFGSFDGALKTRDVNPLDDPKAVEHKFYAKGVGPVLVLSIAPEPGGREELVSYTAGR
jgi:hypothetical protein